MREETAKRGALLKSDIAILVDSKGPSGGDEVRDDDELGPIHLDRHVPVGEDQKQHLELESHISWAYKAKSLM